ncbi:MAG: PAS domain S-box protein [Chloroflexi bacterium]|nr:PAS domain S-box protein [Chloroflexota bacterium]
MDESFPGVVVTKAAGVIDYVNRSPDHILAVDKDGLITSVHWTIPGITVDGEVGRTVYDFVREEYHDVWREALAGVFGVGRRVQFETRALDVSAEAQWYAVTLSAVYESGTVVAGIASLRDITTLKEAEKRMRAIATAVSDMIVVVDEDGLFLEVLAPMEREEFLGLPPPEDLRGRRVQEFLPHDQAERALELVRQTVSTGRPGGGEMLVDLPQGPAWLFARSAPLSLGDGRVVAVVHVLDVSERKRLEEELQRLREEIEAQAEEGVKRASGCGLTFREITVLSLIARGQSDREIAALLGLSRFTVNKHSSNLVHKLGARSRTEAAARAVREGII